MASAFKGRRRKSIFTEYRGMLTKFISRYGIDDAAATAVEYALIAGGIALAVIVGAELMGNSVVGVFTEVGSGL